MSITLARRFVRLVIAAMAFVLGATAAGAQPPATYEVVSIFDVADGRPNGVIQARDGLFYGTSATPGRTSGVVFAMDAAGARTILHRFERSDAEPIVNDVPMSNLFEGADGSLYGTTFNAPSAAVFTAPGQVFRIRPTGEFTTLSLASFLRAGVIQARDSRLYGTSSGGQVSGIGMPFVGYVFRVHSDGTPTVLHRFESPDLASPVAELVEIHDGSLLGTTQRGLVPIPPGIPTPPPTTHGTIFRIDPATGAFTTLHSFRGPDGTSPVAPLIQSSDGRVYGTTTAGGEHGLGTVFTLDADGILTTLHHFAGLDGANPNAGLIQALDGRLYGTTTNGGVFGYGTVFAVTLTGGLTTVHDFALSDGANPVNELIQASDGALYGAAPIGGAGNSGVIFRLLRPVAATAAARTTLSER